MKLKFGIILLLFFGTFYAQNDRVLTLPEYLGYVKKYHPVVKQAQLITNQAEAKLLKARGAFDPKVGVDFNKKEFKETEYYNKLNAAFKIPTWYGVEFKANYEKNSGYYLNPESNVPDDGLYSAGVSVSLAKGLLMNQRMATLKKAKLFNQQAEAEQSLAVNEILYDALTVYFYWLKNYQTYEAYIDFRKNALDRLDNVKTSFEAGEKPAIDTLEASINLNNRKLDVEKARIGYIKAKLKLSNYLWLADNIPLELQENIIPDVNTLQSADAVLKSSLTQPSDSITNQHAKIQALNFKKESLLVDRNLKRNNLLPKVDAQYNFLSEEVNTEYLTTDNYKGGLQVSIPLFLRKERGDLKLAQAKLQDMDFEISAQKVAINNKIEATYNEIESYTNQQLLLNGLVNDYERLVNAEERKFLLGEGSIFLINYREVKLIEAKIKQIETENKFLNAKASMHRMLSNIL